MQTLKIVNPVGAAVEFRPDKPNGRIAPYIFGTLHGLGKPETAIFATQPPGMSGQMPQERLYESRELEFKGYVYGQTQYELYERLALLNRAISGLKGDVRFEYTNDYGSYYINGTVTDPVEYGDRLQYSGNEKLVELTIVCSDPFWRPIGGKLEATIAYKAGRFKFLFKIPPQPYGVAFGRGGTRGIVINTGDSPAPVEITITGPADYPAIRNATTGKQIRLNKQISRTQTLYINTGRGAKAMTITDVQTGATQDVWRYADIAAPGYALWSLAPGMNEILYDSGASTQDGALVVLSWESRVTGV